MTPLFKKLNFKDHKSILVLNSPASLQDELAEMTKETTIIYSIDDAKEIVFALVFVTTQTAIEQAINYLYKKLKGDAILWMCYPKGTSKKFKCDFNRDTGWASLGKLNLEPVRMVAIDEDWSALRFRKVEYIKTITRRESFALTKDAKRRTTQKGI